MTVDVDINVFVPPDAVDRVAEVLVPLGIDAPASDVELARRERAGAPTVG